MIIIIKSHATPYTQSSPGERSGKFSQNGKFGQNGKFSQNGIYICPVRKVKCIYVGPNVSSSAHDRGCAVDAVALWQQYEYYYYYYYYYIKSHLDLYSRRTSTEISGCK